MENLDGLIMKTKKLPVRYKMTRYQVAEAIEHLDSGVTYVDLGVHYGIDHRIIARYVRCAELYGYSFWSENPRQD